MKEKGIGGMDGMIMAVMILLSPDTINPAMATSTSSTTTTAAAAAAAAAMIFFTYFPLKQPLLLDPPPL
jgi:hypothetical protein